MSIKTQLFPTFELAIHYLRPHKVTVKVKAV